MVVVVGGGGGGGGGNYEQSKKYCPCSWTVKEIYDIQKQEEGSAFQLWFWLQNVIIMFRENTIHIDKDKNWDLNRHQIDTCTCNFQQSTTLVLETKHNEDGRHLVCTERKLYSKVDFSMIARK